MSNAERLDCGRKLRGIGSIYGMKDALIKRTACPAIRFISRYVNIELDR